MGGYVISLLTPAQTEAQLRTALPVSASQDEDACASQGAAPVCEQDMRTRSRKVTWQDDNVVGPLLSYLTEMDSTSTKSQPMSTVLTASSGGCFAEPSQTLIFLDWDDTVFPTTELFHSWRLPHDYNKWESLQLTEEQENVMENWRGVLQEYLGLACSLSSRVVIVTNSQRPWVEKCVEHFAPNIKYLFEREEGGTQVVYAREEMPQRLQSKNTSLSHEELEVQLTKAKFLAMRRIAREFYSQYPDQTWKNIISIGDASYEHDAIQDVAFHRKSPEREHIRLKAITTPSGPSIADLTLRLRLGYVLFPAYVQYDGEIDLDMNTPDRMQNIANCLEMPEIMSIMRTRTDKSKQTEKLDELAMMLQTTTL